MTPTPRLASVHAARVLLGLAATLAACAPSGAPPSAPPPAAQDPADKLSNTCSAPFTPAWAVQGTGERTPLEGRTVVVEGVVVADLEGPAPALRGFYLQDVAGDDDPASSDALFVFNGNADDVAPGDLVRVIGTAGEFNGQTQLTREGWLRVCDRGRAVAPVDVTLPFPSAAWPERLEGMLVRFPQTLHVTDLYNLGRFGEVALSSGGRLAQPTQVAPPGAAALALQRANDLDRILLDDATHGQNPDPIPFGRGGEPLAATNTLRGGDTVQGVVGVLTWGWGGNQASGEAWRLRPLHALGGGPPAFAAANPRPARPVVTGTTRIGSFNVLNYFNTFEGCTGGAWGESVDCRGAGDAAAFERQWRKTVAAMAAMEVDILGVVEVENDGYGVASALAHLADRLNEATAGRWAFVDVDAATGVRDALGSDAIKVGVLYRADRVRPVGSTAALATAAFVTGGDPGPRSRPSLAQAFETVGGGRLVVSINHLKSKGSPCAAPDAGDGQGNCNQVRTAAARELARWLAADPTGTGDPDILLLGDLNAYAMEDPLQALAAAGYVNLLATDPSEGGYSYGYGGQWGSLDHALASPTLAGAVTGAAVWHINADEPPILDYGTAFKSPRQREVLYAPDPYRSSDHDPVVVGVRW